MVLKFFRGQVGQGNISHREIQHQQPPFTVDSGAKNLKMPIFPQWNDFLKNPDPSVARVFPKLYIAYLPPNMIEKNVVEVKTVLDSPFWRNVFPTLQKCTFALYMGIKSGFSYLGIYQTGSNKFPMVFIPSSRPNYKIWVKNNGGNTVLKYSKPRYKLVTFQVLMPKIDWGHMAWATWVKIWKTKHKGINCIYFPSKWAQDYFDRPTISASDVKFKMTCLGFLGK